MPRTALAAILSPILAPALTAFLALPAIADTIRVTITGSVENNGFRAGTLASVRPGDRVNWSFNVDSTVFLNSPNFPGQTRGYVIQNPSFALQIGAVNVPLLGNPVSYFVIRDNDPGADGFFTSPGTDFDAPIPVNIGLANFGIRFQRAFNDALALSSLNILDALGTYGQENLSVYGFDVEISENITPLILIYESITLTNITPRPCPADFDQDGFLTPGDIDDFITEFFETPPDNDRADFDGNGFVTPDDLDDFITAFFARC